MKKFDIRQPIGIAFGSGTARGLAHIGVLKVLEATGVRVGYIAGSSMGALIGAAYAIGISPAEMEEIGLQIDRKRQLKFFTPKLSKQSLIADNTIMEFLESLYGDKRIEDLPIPFRAVSVDFSTGERIVISEGKLVDAIRASISIPMILRPFEWEGRLYADGALVDPVPVGALCEMGAPYTIAVPLANPRIDEKTPPAHLISEKDKSQENGKHRLEKHPIIGRFSRFLVENKLLEKISGRNASEDETLRHLNMLDALWQTFSVTESELTRLHLEANPPDLIIRPNVSWIQMWELHKARDIIAMGEEATKEALQNLQQAN